MDVYGGIFRKVLRKTSYFFNIFSTSTYFFFPVERTYMLNLPKQMLSGVKTNCAET